MGPFQILIWHVKTVSNFATTRIETVLTCQVSNLSWHVFWFLTWWNGLKICLCKIWENFKFCSRFNFCPDMVKRSQILWLRYMGPFQIYQDMCFDFWHGETVSNFAAAKYGTVSNFVMTWRNGLKFCGCKIWDRFDFWLMFQILRLQDIWPFQNLSRHSEMVSLLWKENIESFQYKILRRNEII